MKLFVCLHRQLIATIVEFVVSVPFDFDKGDLVDLHKGEKFFPKVDVFDFGL